MTQSNEIANHILLITKKIIKNDFSNISKVLISKHYIESVFISILNYQKIKKTKIELSDSVMIKVALTEMADLGLLSSDVVDFYNNSTADFSKDIFVLSDIDLGQIGVLRENLFLNDIVIQGDTLSISNAKTVRDTSGSYYTPKRLACEVVCEAIERYTSLNVKGSSSEIATTLSAISYADLSCGSGEFFLAILDVLWEKYDISPQTVVVNFYGADIDPLARQTAICNLLPLVSAEVWPTIIANIHLGNPLIIQEDEKNIEYKTKLFAFGRYYNSNMGINFSNASFIRKYDIIVGNPPWEKIRFEERKYLKRIDSDLGSISQKAERDSKFLKLKEQNPCVYALYDELQTDYSNFKADVRSHPLLDKSLSGELNTYALFTELALSLLSKSGIASLVVKSALVTSPANKPIFLDICKQGYLLSLLLFDNKKRLFDIDSREKFCVITYGKKKHQTFQVKSGLSSLEEIHSIEWEGLSAADIERINPISQMFPNISNNQDISLLLQIHSRLPLFKDVYPHCHFGRIVHLTTHSKYINTTENAANLPIYEGKFIEQYDARFATFAEMTPDKKYSSKAHANKNTAKNGILPLPESRFFIDKSFWDKISANYKQPYMLCWRSLTATTNSKTTIAMILPKMPTCQSIQLLQTQSNKELLLLLALFNSTAFDKIVRLKMPGIDLTQTVINQIPVPPQRTYAKACVFQGKNKSIEQHILERVCGILKNEEMLTSLISDVINLGYEVINKDREVLKSEINTLFEIAYSSQVI